MRALEFTASRFAIGFALLAVAPATAAAQSAPASKTASSGGGDVVSEVIVTATKHAENLQNVPISISAVTADTLKSRNIVDISRLDALVPGFKFGQSGNDARPAIRGTRTQQVIGNADPLVAFYQDGVYRSRPGQALSTFTDVERVEVARGPQGTLFGRNSFGGAVNVITRAPVLGLFDYGANGTFTNYSGVRGEAFVNIPLGESLALRVSGFSSRRDGWVKNLANTANSIHDDNNQVIRGQLKFQSSIFSNVLRVEYWHGGGAGPGDFGYYTPGVPIDPTTKKTNGVVGVIDPVIAVVPGRGGGYGGLPAGTLGDPDWRHISTNFPFLRRVHQTSVSDEANVDAGFADIRGIFSYTDYNEFRQGDPDYSAKVQDGAYNRVTARTTSEEIQVVSKPGGPLSWVVGGYFLQDRPTDLYVFGDDLTGRVNAAGQPYRTILSTNPADNTHNGYDNLYVQGPFESKADSIAFYGDGTFAVTSRLRVIGGVRWTQDRRTATIQNVPFAGYPPLNTEGPTRKTFRKVTWRAGGQFDIAPRSMFYATYSTGYLAGGFSGAPSFSLTSSSLASYDPQTVKAIEAGLKNVLLDGRLRANLSVYKNNYTNLVTQKLVQIGNAVSTTTANAGAIHSYGAEAEVDYYPVQGAYLGVRAAYTHARFGDYLVGNSFQEGANAPANSFQLHGLQVPLNPTFSITVTGSYDFDTGATGIFTPSVTVFSSTKYRTSDQPYFFANQPGYTTVDAFVRWKPSSDSKLSAQLFVNNLTDERVLLRTTPNAGSVIYQDFAPPRIFGARIAWNY